MEEGSFRTVGRTDVVAVTAAEMREVDRVATEEIGLALLSMMENAGRNLARAVRKRRVEEVVVVAGSGGNGGGGLACGRHLRNRNVDVTVVLDRPAADLGGATARQHRILDEMGSPIHEGIETLPDCDVVVDAVIGYGLDGAVSGTAADLVEACNAADAYVLSLDVPSGLDATTGAAPGPVVDPDRVLTLALPKTGLRDGDYPLTLADIGIPKTVYERLEIPADLPFDDTYLLEIQRM